MERPDRRRNLRRRYRCRLVFAWLTRFERLVMILSQVVRNLAIITAALSLIFFIVHEFGRAHSWIMEILAKGAP